MDALSSLQYFAFAYRNTKGITAKLWNYFPSLESLRSHSSNLTLGELRAYRHHLWMRVRGLANLADM